jgi:hypothetical protein
MDASEPLEATAPPPRRRSWRDVVDNKWAVLGLIFFAMMFLGLPLLWASRAFSRVEKVVYTFVVLLYSVAAFGCFAAIMWWCYERVVSALPSL